MRISDWSSDVCSSDLYHVHAIHPEILPIFNDYHAQIDLYPHGMRRMVTKFAYESPRLGSGETGLNDALKALMREVGLDPEDFRGRHQDVSAAIQKAKRERATRMGVDSTDVLYNLPTDTWQ